MTYADQVTIDASYDLLQYRLHTITLDRCTTIAGASERCVGRGLLPIDVCAMNFPLHVRLLCTAPAAIDSVEKSSRKGVKQVHEGHFKLVA